LAEVVELAVAHDRRRGRRRLATLPLGACSLQSRLATPTRPSRSSSDHAISTRSTPSTPVANCGNSDIGRPYYRLLTHWCPPNVHGGVLRGDPHAAARASARKRHERAMERKLTVLDHMARALQDQAEAIVTAYLNARAGARRLASIGGARLPSPWKTRGEDRDEDRCGRVHVVGRATYSPRLREHPELARLRPVE
jgi:hypothetical protein